MKRIKTEVWVGAAAAAVAFSIVACGGLGGNTDTGCTDDASCGTGLMCHPTLKTCVTSCTGSVDCPSSAKTCATYAGNPYSADAGVAAFCQCSTDALCGDSQVCQDTSSKICTAKCTADGDCGTGATCDTATGKCKGSATVVDAGVDAGTTVDAGTPCNSTLAQPDVCGYGSACFSDNTCDVLTDGTCSNVTAAISKGNHTAWTAAAGTGPVVFSVTHVTDVPGDCAAAPDGGVASAFTVLVGAYSTTDFPANKSNLPGFWYYTVSGNKVDIPTNLLKPSNYTASGKNMSAKFTLCSDPGATQLQAAFGFTNGNAECALLTK